MLGFNDELFIFSGLLEAKKINKNTISGALNRTNTLNSPDVKPTKKPKSKTKIIEKTRNSFERMKARCLIMFPFKKKNLKAKNNSNNPSNPLINKKALFASQMNGLKKAVAIAKGLARSIPVAE